MSDELARIVRIYPDGSVRKLHGAADDERYGTASRRRASHIVPVNRLLRWMFRLIRYCVSDESRIAAWTRRWPCLWSARIIGGPDLGSFDDRAAAIAAEQKWLVDNWVCEGLNPVFTSDQDSTTVESKEPHFGNLPKDPKENWMLVLSRKKDEKIMIGEDIVITIVDIRGDRVRLGVHAPRDLAIHREEVQLAINKSLEQPSEE